MKKVYYWALVLGIGIICVYYLIKDIDTSIITNLTLENIFYILVIKVVGMSAYVLCLRILLGGMGYKASIRSLYLVLTSSLAANYTTPVKIGIPLRVYLYKKILNVPVSIGTAAIAIETFISTLVSVAISIFAIMTLFTEYSLKIPLFVILFLFVFFYLVIFFEPRKLKKITSRLPFQSKINRLLEFGTNFQKGIKQTSKRSLLSFSLLVLLMYVTSALHLYVVLLIFGVEINLLYLLYIQAISFVAGTISMIPMGLGVRDASIVLLLMNLGVPNEIAISAAIVERTLTTGLNFVLGVISASVLGIKFLEFRNNG